MVGRQRANRLQRKSSDTDNCSLSPDFRWQRGEGPFSHLAREPCPVCVLRGRRSTIAGKLLSVRSYALYSVQVHLLHALRTPYARAFPIPCTILQVNCQWGICSVLRTLLCFVSRGARPVGLPVSKLGHRACNHQSMRHLVPFSNIS